jgi:predicted O-methyltransferase YrrM
VTEVAVRTSLLSDLRTVATVVVRHYTRGRESLPLTWVRRGGWLGRRLTDSFTAPPVRGRSAIVLSEARTALLGRQPLWEGYREGAGAARTSRDVGTAPAAGAFYTWLVQERRPRTVVEFGTAFGVSGMFFLAGLERVGAGRLLTFEPNADWRAAALRNLDRVGRRYVSIQGTFEENLSVVDAPIDLAFIDAIHTSDFVEPQFELVRERLAPGGIVIIDDIDFSADMAACWRRLATRDDVVASVALGGRVGVLETAASDQAGSAAASPNSARSRSSSATT